MTLKWTEFIPHEPTAKQLAFLSLPHREAFFGGAAGGGKSDALLMAALQYVDVPGYSAILFRKTLSELKLPNSLLDRAHNWLSGKNCVWVAGEHKYLFPTKLPSGEPGTPAVLAFGYIGQESAKQRYQSSEYQMIGFDEVTHHYEEDYTWMMSRLRKVACLTHRTDPSTGSPIYDPTCPECSYKSQVPIRMRAASNPGSHGHQWVQNRFQISPEPHPQEPGKLIYLGHNRDAPFIPSFVRDNPYLDRVAYELQLDQLDPLTRAQLKDGDWGASADARFKRKWFDNRRYSRRGDYITLGPNATGFAFLANRFQRIFVTVDPAASAKEGPGDTQRYKKAYSSYTVAAVFGLTDDYKLLWLDNYRILAEIPDINRLLKSIYRTWRPSYFIIEATGLGKGVFQLAQKAGLPVRATYPHHDKIVRATDAMTRAEQGYIWLPESPGPSWLKLLEDELFTWTGHPHQQDDQVDALSHAAQDVSWEAAQTEQAFDPEMPAGSMDVPDIIYSAGNYPGSIGMEPDVGRSLAGSVAPWSQY